MFECELESAGGCHAGIVSDSSAGEADGCFYASVARDLESATALGLSEVAATFLIRLMKRKNQTIHQRPHSDHCHSHLQPEREGLKACAKVPTFQMSADMGLSSAGVVLSLKIAPIFLYNTKLFLQWKRLRDKPERKIADSVQVKLNGQHLWHNADYHKNELPLVRLFV